MCWYLGDGVGYCCCYGLQIFGNFCMVDGVYDWVNGFWYDILIQQDGDLVGFGKQFVFIVEDMICFLEQFDLLGQGVGYIYCVCMVLEGVVVLFGGFVVQDDKVLYLFKFFYELVVIFVMNIGWQVC